MGRLRVHVAERVCCIPTYSAKVKSTILFWALLFRMLGGQSASAQPQHGFACASLTT
jgi:hypothetical protein